MDNRSLIPFEGPEFRGPRQYPTAPYHADVTLDDGGSEALLDFWDVFRRRKWLILGLTLLGTVAGVVISIPKPIIYRASTTIEVQMVNENFMGLGQIDPQAGSYTPTETNLNTQMAILNSQTLKGEVVRRLQRETIPSIPPTPPGHFYNLRQRVLTLMRRSTPQDPLTAMGEALAIASSKLVVGQVRGTRIIELGCESTDPYIASSFVNTLADEFMEQSLAARLQGIQRAGGWMTNQVAELKTRLEASEQELQRFVASVGGPGRFGEQDAVMQMKLQQMERDVAALRAEYSNKQSLADAVAKASPEEIATAPEGVRLQPLVLRLAELKNQLAALGASVTPAHYKHRQLQEQIAETEGVIRLERNVVVTRVNREAAEAKRRLDLNQVAYNREVGKAGVSPDRLLTYNVLKRQAEGNRQLYQAMLQNLNMAGLATAAPTNNLRVIDRAQANLKPDDLRGWVMNTCLGFVSGMLLSVVLSTLLHKLKQRVKYPGDASMLLRVPELGVIPSRIASTPQRPWWHRKRARSRPFAGLPQKVELAAMAAEPSWLAESFRNTLASLIDPNGKNAAAGVIVITSPGPREGKSTIASNLAIALAEADRRVLLMDGDLRASRLHEIFHRQSDWGLREIITGETPIEEYTVEMLGQPTEVLKLCLLAGGRCPVRMGNVFYSQRFRDLLHRLRKEYDHIIIDTPPVLAFADARLVGHLCDGTILVLRADETRLADAIAAYNRLRDDGVVVLGTVLNNCDFVGRQSRYPAHYHHYYATPADK